MRPETYEPHASKSDAEHRVSKDEAGGGECDRRWLSSPARRSRAGGGRPKGGGGGGGAARDSAVTKLRESALKSLNSFSRVNLCAGAI
jgi:hypothetical protein